MKLLFLFMLFLLSCSSSPVKTTDLKVKNLVGYWSPISETRFNHMDIKCNGDFVFNTFNYQDHGVHISEIQAHSFKTSPQNMGHYYQVIEWPTPQNDFLIRLKYINDSFISSMSSSLSKINSEKSKKIYTFKRSKKYNCD